MYIYISYYVIYIAPIKYQPFDGSVKKKSSVRPMDPRIRRMDCVLHWMMKLLPLNFGVTNFP